MSVQKGGCACGAVRFETLAEPLRVGLCHCLTCRKHHGSIFNPFVVFADSGVLMSGPLRAWRSSEKARRLSCKLCASPVCYLDGEANEIELYLGSFDAPGVFKPQYENWVVHREDWLPSLGLDSYCKGRAEPADPKSTPPPLSESAVTKSKGYLPLGQE